MALAETSATDAIFPLAPSDVPILHIRCGSDILEGLQQAGIPGSFLEVSDPVCQGPLDPRLPEAALRRRRADFIAATYRGFDDTSAVLVKLEREQAGLQEIGRFQRIVLWFEHDLFDQAILIRLLARLRDCPDLHGRLSMITLDAFPGIARFTGLGQLAPDQLASLWGQERPVTSAQLDEATALWQVYAANEPLALQRALETTSGALPFAARAMTRHLQELPWRGSGLGLTEQLALTALAQGAGTPGRVFARMVEDLDPLPYLGDAMFWPLLAGLAAAPEPAATPFADWRDEIALTTYGQDLIDGRANWLDHNPLDRWVGGLHLSASNAPFLWDPKRGQAMAGQRA